MSFEKSGHLERVGGHSRQRLPGDGPVLLDQIPRSFVTSPAMYPIGFAIAILYGIVLYQVVSSQKRSREESAHETRVASVEALPADVAIASTSAPSTPAPAAAPVQPAIAKSETPAPSNTTPVPEKTVTTPAATPETSPKTVVAAADIAPPKPEPEKVSVGRPTTWGDLEGTLFDCKTRIDLESLTIEIPATLHFLSPEFNSKNAPRFLRAVDGDVSVSVFVGGDFSPGSEPLEGFPLTYQGAGILFWTDENNYLRFERAERFLGDRGKSHILLLETCHNGKTSKAYTRDARDVDMTLKIDRKGSEFHCTYTVDGRNWIEFRRQTFAMPAAVLAGVSASNVSRQPFSPRFDKFEIKNPSAKSAKGS